MKKTLAFLSGIVLCLVMLFTLSPMTETSAAGEGEVTPKNGVYEIENADQFIWIARNVTEGNIKLKADIEIPGNYSRACIGTERQPFTGTFDGNKKTITLSGKNGVFDTVGDCEIKNLTVKSNIDSTNSEVVVGAVASKAVGKVTISNVTVSGKVHGFYVGGFIGIADGNADITIDSCTNEAEVWGLSKAGKYANAGFIAEMEDGEALISNSTNSGYVTASACDTAGFVGRVGVEASAKITDCTNTGDIRGYGVEGKDFSSGGFIAVSTGEIEVLNSLNSGYVAGTHNGTGAVVGYVKGGSALVKNCINIGQVFATKNFTGCIGYADVKADIEASDNRSIGPMESKRISKYVEGVSDELEFVSRASVRLDNYAEGAAWVKFSTVVRTDLMSQYGISGKDAVLGYYDSEFKFVRLDVPQRFEKYEDGMKTVFEVTAKDVPAAFMRKDLFIRVNLEAKNVTGYWENGVSLAAIGRKVAEEGYKANDDTELSADAKKLIDTFESNIKTVVFVGDSITDGVRSSTGQQVHRNPNNPVFDNLTGWPERMGAHLGSAYNIVNCGVSGRTMSRSELYGGYGSFIANDHYKRALKAVPDYVIIMLGTNDASFGNSKLTGEEFAKKIEKDFKDTCREMIDEFVSVNEDVKIYLLTEPMEYRTAKNANAIGVGYEWAAGTEANHKYVLEWIKETYDTLSSEGYNIRLADMHDATDDWEIELNNVFHSEVEQYFDQDMLHLIDRGYEHMARFMYNEFKKED